MKIKNFTLVADATASIVGAIASYFFFHPFVPMAFSEFALASEVVVSALFIFYVVRKCSPPRFKNKEIPNEQIGVYVGTLLPFYLVEAALVVGVTFFALIGTFFGFLFWKYLIVPYIPAIHLWF
jgi:hypothetical protein